MDFHGDEAIAARLQAVEEYDDPGFPPREEPNNWKALDVWIYRWARNVRGLEIVNTFSFVIGFDSDEAFNDGAERVGEWVVKADATVEKGDGNQLTLRISVSNPRNFGVEAVYSDPLLKFIRNVMGDIVGIKRVDGGGKEYDLFRLPSPGDDLFLHRSPPGFLVPSQPLSE